MRERPVLSSYLVDTVMANRDFVEKRVMVRGAGKMHEVSTGARLTSWTSLSKNILKWAT